MKRMPPRWRCEFAFGLLAVAMVGLTVRLVLLIQEQGARAAELAERQQRRVIRVPGRMGEIFARTRNGYVLVAGSKQTPSCFADPALVPEQRIIATASELGEALELPPRDVLKSIVSRREKRFVWIKRDLLPVEADAVRSIGNPAVGVMREWRRYYPNGPLAATVLGFRHIDGGPGGGLEATLDQYLQAEAGRRVTLVDAARRPIWTIPDESRPARDGFDVFLCLDARIQGFLERAVRESVARFGIEGQTWATGVVVEPYSGRVLAMCSVPSFDPGNVDPEQLDRCANRTVSMPFEPGSAAKPLFAAAAVEAELLTYDSELFCENGVWRAPRGGTIRDHGESHGDLTLTDINVFSSNIGMGKVGLLLGNERLHATAHAYGFGRPTGIGLPGEDAGIVRELAKWNTYSTPRVPFGQEISVTQIQLAMAFSALVNGGVLLKPRVVEEIREASGEVVHRGRTEAVRRVLSERVSVQTREVLRQVVARGTGKTARLSQWSSFGKTGTAQIAGPGGYVEGAYTGTFVGGAPVSRPRLLCAISVYHPDAERGYYGSKVAAPYVKQVLERALEYLDVPSDLGTASADGAQTYLAGR